MPSDHFARLTFKGARFHQAAMPLEALPELAAYRDLVLAFAKILFKRNNPERQRLPKGFEDDLKLVLESMAAGSTVAAIARRPAEPDQLFPPPDARDYFAEARDVITGIIDAEGQTELDAEFRDALGRFTAFGRTLNEDESILVGSPSRPATIPYTKGVRKRILLRNQTTYEDEISLVGEVRQVDKDTDAFSIKTAEGRRITIPSLPLFFNLALRSLEGAGLAKVRGTGQFDANGHLVKVLMATDVSLVEEGEADAGARAGCPAALDHQVDGLLSLPAGWLDGEGSPYRETELRWLKELMNNLVTAFHLPAPYVYPSPDGEVRLEWSTNQHEVTLSIQPADRSAWALAVDVRTQDSAEQEVSLSEPGAESRLGAFLAERLSTN